MSTAQQFLGIVINFFLFLSLGFLAIALIAFVTKRQAPRVKTTPTTPAKQAPLSQLTVSIDEPSSTDLEPPASPDPEMVKQSQEKAENSNPVSIDLEQEAPEADLAPPAEPLGDSDPIQRQEL